MLMAVQFPALNPGPVDLGSERKNTACGPLIQSRHSFLENLVGALPGTATWGARNCAFKRPTVASA
jgi:hypothetical protein